MQIEASKTIKQKNNIERPGVLRKARLAAGREFRGHADDNTEKQACNVDAHPIVVGSFVGLINHFIVARQSSWLPKKIASYSHDRLPSQKATLRGLVKFS